MHNNSNNFEDELTMAVPEVWLVDYRYYRLPTSHYDGSSRKKIWKTEVVDDFKVVVEVRKCSLVQFQWRSGHVITKEDAFGLGGCENGNSRNNHQQKWQSSN